MKSSVKYFIEKRKHFSPLGYLETHLKVPSDLAAIMELQASLSKKETCTSIMDLQSRTNWTKDPELQQM
jgi:hypothetical protein